MSLNAEVGRMTVGEIAHPSVDEREAAISSGRLEATEGL